MHIHVWVPDFTGATGGIQTLSRFLVQGLRDCFPGAKLRVFAKNDTSAPDVEERSLAHFDSVGTWPEWQRTAAFTSKLLWSAYRDRPDLIVTAHVNFAPVAHVLQRLFLIPFIALGNGIEVWNISSASVKRALRAANSLIAISECTKQRMASELNISPSRISLFPCTFDSEKFCPAAKPRFLLQRYGLRPDQPVILTIARLAGAERYKGYDQVLRAFATVRDQFSNVHYILGGRGRDRARVIKLIRELDLTRWVTLAGFIPQHELCAHYNLCDVFAMPSKGEGFGIVFLEAASCGKPVIAGNKDGSVDAVLNGRLGVLVDPDSVDEIANAITRVLGGQRTEDKEQRSEVRGQKSEGIRLRQGSDGTREVPEIVFEPERLRREVIEAYGYQRFKHRLAEVLKPLVPCS
jgi:glycosyltransferase involved in cell wall biosynthesis